MSEKKQKVKLMNIILVGIQEYESYTGVKIKSVELDFEKSTFEICLKDKKTTVN